MRKKQAKKRPLLPDSKFNDKLVTRFVNMMMWSGKKSVAFRIFYDAIDVVETKKADEEKQGTPPSRKKSNDETFDPPKGGSHTHRVVSKDT